MSRRFLPKVDYQAVKGSMMAHDILAGLGAVCGTGVGVSMLAFGLPAWTLAVPFFGVSAERVAACAGFLPVKVGQPAFFISETRM